MSTIKPLLRNIEGLTTFIRLVADKLPKQAKIDTDNDLARILKDHTKITDEQKLYTVFTECNKKLSSLRVKYPLYVRKAELERNTKKMESQKEEPNTTHEEILNKIKAQTEHIIPPNWQFNETAANNIDLEKKAKELASKRLVKPKLADEPMIVKLEEFNSEFGDDISESKGVETFNIDSTNTLKAEEEPFEETKKYVMRDGQVVEREGERRQEADYTNWCGANADPEDIQKHKELMDRQHFGGPKWEGIIVRRPWDYDIECNPEDLYNAQQGKIDAELLKEGEHKFEKIVR